MKTFDEYWEQYGELHASMCGGDIKQFAMEIWKSAISLNKPIIQQDGEIKKTEETEIMEEFRQLSRRVRQLPLDVQMSIITSMRCNLEAVAFSVILKMPKKDELFKYEEGFKQ